MATKQMQKCSTFLVKRNMQIKTITRYHIPIEMTKLYLGTSLPSCRTLPAMLIQFQLCQCGSWMFLDLIKLIG